MSATESPPSSSAPAPSGMRTFMQVLVNTAVVNVTTNYLWWALIFWAYLETRSVLATGIIGGAFMLLISIFGMVFGSIVDRHRKHTVMVVATIATLAAFGVAAVMLFSIPERVLLDLGAPWFWLFAGIILLGAVVENLRNIALSTTVTLLVPRERHANANGMVGTVQGVGFIVTSVFSGLSVGLLGMRGTMVIALVLIGLALVHLLTFRMPEDKPMVEEGRPKVIDIRGSVAAVRAASGLFALILFSTFNNFVGGVFMALLDPYGLEMFAVEIWGIVLGVTSIGFVVGGLLIAKFGLGKKPIRTMLLLVALMGVIGAVFTIRDWAWLFIVGVFLYMLIVPAIEAAEQTVIQRVVPFETQGRVFGFAQTFEASAAPITSFLIAPIAQIWVIPYMESGEGQQAWGWLLGDGVARGIAFVFLIAGAIMVLVAFAAFLTKSYRLISKQFEERAASADAATADAERANREGASEATVAEAAPATAE